MSKMYNQKRIFGESFDISEDKSVKLYPHFDGTVMTRSCENEVNEPIFGEVQGDIPKWINGSLLRNSPGKHFGDVKYNHIFDAAALIHKFHIENGTVTYMSRFVQSEMYKRNMAANRIVVNSFGTKAIPDPCQTIFQYISSVFKEGYATDNTNLSIYPMGDDVYALTEGAVMHRISIDSLDTVGRVTIGDKFGVLNHSSHPFVMSDKTVYNLGMTVENRIPKYNIIRFENGSVLPENASIVAQIPAQWQFNPSYMHSFSITDNYFILIEIPFSLSAMEVLKTKIFKKEMMSIFKWFENEYTLIHVISRKSGERKYTFKATAFMFFHTINAYETKDHIIVDISCYSDPSTIECMYIEALDNMQSIKNFSKKMRNRPLRFVLPTKQWETKKRQKLPQKSFSLLNSLNKFVFGTSKVDKEQFLKNHQITGKIIGSWKFAAKFWQDFERQYSVENLVQIPKSEAKAYLMDDSSIFCVPELLCDYGCEAPRINEYQSIGKEYQYFYAFNWEADSEDAYSLIKVDTVNKSVLTWKEDNIFPSEPIFVPSPNSLAEDDGIILSSIVWGNGDTNRAGLLILCATTFKEIGRCVFNTPEPVTKCFHGMFQPA